jgi:hypothetical protein
MVNQASWLYNQIINWHQGILQGQLLDNFSLGWVFIEETIFRKDFPYIP